MADAFDITGKPVRATATGKQSLDQAIEVSAYDEVETTCDDILANSRYLGASGWTRSDVSCGLTTACL